MVWKPDFFSLDISGKKPQVGDNDKVVYTICKQVGLEVNNMLPGADLDSMSDVELFKAAEITEVFAKLTPAQKARVITVLRDNGHTVGGMGDGMNDAAAMKAADIILLEKDLRVLEEGIIEGRTTYTNIIKYIRMTASSNFGNMFAALYCHSLG